ncbi:MAG: hypothetical protein KA715_13170 [Xanthomonadaceae bacterium]|nr:hypothetical protein [Xanthomonadaceae bacterium]
MWLYLMCALALSSSSAQSPKQVRKAVENRLEELTKRLQIQTLMMIDGTQTNTRESDRIFKKLVEVDINTLKLKGNFLRVITHGFETIPRKARTIGRDLGPSVMVFFVSAEGSSIVTPIVLTAIGEAELAAAIIAVPIVIPAMIAIVIVNKFSKNLKENKIYGGYKNRRDILSQQKKYLESIGIKNIEKTLYFEGEKLPKISELKRAMMNDQELNKLLRPILNHYQWTKNERVLFMLAQAQKHFDEGEESISSTQLESSTSLDLENWTIRASQAMSFAEVPDLFYSIPLAGNYKASTVFRLWYYLIIPSWVKNMSDKGLKKYRCLKKNDYILHAEADIAKDRIWDPDDELKLKNYLSQCGVL